MSIQDKTTVKAEASENANIIGDKESSFFRVSVELSTGWHFVGACFAVTEQEAIDKIKKREGAYIERILQEDRDKIKKVT